MSTIMTFKDIASIFTMGALIGYLAGIITMYVIVYICRKDK